MNNLYQDMKSTLIIWYAIILHGWWGVLVLLSPEDVVGITAIHTSQSILGSTYVLGSGYLVSSIFSLYAMRLPANPVGLALVLPQQFFLVTSAIGALIAIIRGQFADGVPRSWIFIAADQFPAILISVLHTIALIRIYAANVFPRRML